MLNNEINCYYSIVYNVFMCSCMSNVKYICIQCAMCVHRFKIRTCLNQHILNMQLQFNLLN